ncbi:hypothetical protein FCM35_KLT13655 [Carex littledalei]|uniref:Agenet domain-containing protein n=1 Tax=Carex littledalei TaxID=544730 RepID=A0A833VFE9_9POAL|nr:hypothetical protein FCM35_KLT13655 [Carex littledalei]
MMKPDPMTKAPSKDTTEVQGSASVSRSTGDAFPAGAEVEVKISSEGFYDSRYEAKVLSRYSTTRSVKYKVEYLNLLDDGSQQPLVEDVFAKNVRPRAPRRLSTHDAGNEDEDPNFKMHDLVEEYHNDGWWHGVVSGLRNPVTGLYTVSFPNSREVFQCKPAEIRPHLDYVNGKWVPVLGQAQKRKTFKKGDKVEVYGLGDNYALSYFPAQVEKVIHNSFYLVKYASVSALPNGDETEILDPQFLRPAQDTMPGTNPFAVDSHVEVFHEGCWSHGVVLSGPNGSNYAVTLESKGEPMTMHFDVSNMRLWLDWDGRRWSNWGSPSKVKKRKSVNISKSFTSDITLTEESETTPRSVTSTGKKLKKGRQKEVQELQSPSGNVFTPSCSRKDLESDNEIFISELFGESKSSKNTSSSSPRIRHAVRKISKSHKLLTELKDCQSKISTGRRSSPCKRNLKSWVTYKKKDKVNYNRQTTSEKQKDVNLSNKNSSDVPQPNTNGEKAAAHVHTTSCQQQLSNTNYTADRAGENAIGVSSYDRAVSQIVGSESQCLLNTQEDEVNHNRRTTSEKEKDVNLSNESSSDVPHPNTKASNTNYTANLAGENAIGVSSHDRAVSHIVGSESQCLLNTRDSFTDGVAKISKGQLVNSQPLNSSATMEHPTGSQDESSNPSLSRPVSSGNQAAPLSLLENSVSTETNHNSKFKKHTPVESITYDILLPFEKTSPLWKTLETTLKAFSRIPQMPHFMKLESECKDIREGLAIGMMVTYDTLSESIQRLSIHTEATVFEEKISCLESLEENGFIVDPIRSRLQRLLEIKKKYTESAVKRVELENTLVKKEMENMSSHATADAYEAQLEYIRKSIAELKEKEKALMAEKAGVLDSTVELERDISSLREEISSINRSNELAPEEFESPYLGPLSCCGFLDELMNHHLGWVCMVRSNMMYVLRYRGAAYRVWMDLSGPLCVLD